MRHISSSMLPSDFIPGDNHIIIGRGRATKEHSANVKFDRLIANIARDYQAAPTKSKKGFILSKLMAEIHAPSRDAGFVKKDPDTGRWHTVEESLARTTAAQAIRNYLSGDYRSSKQFKQIRRLQRIHQMNMSSSSSSSSPVNSPMMTPATSSLNHPQVSPESSDDEDHSSKSHSRIASHKTGRMPVSDTFSILFSTFGMSASANIAGEDPFSPRPILEVNSNNLPTTTMCKMESTPRNSLLSMFSSRPVPDIEPVPLSDTSFTETEDWMSTLLQTI